MKIKIYNWDECCNYNIDEFNYNQGQFDYIFKYLNVDKLYKNKNVCFKNYETEEWFNETYTNSHYLSKIHNQSPDGYQWLKNNWGNGVFKLYVFYSDKQELKTIVNKIINIELIRKRKNEI